MFPEVLPVAAAPAAVAAAPAAVVTPVPGVVTTGVALLAGGAAVASATAAPPLREHDGAAPEDAEDDKHDHISRHDLHSPLVNRRMTTPYARAAWRV